MILRQQRISLENKNILTRAVLLVHDTRPFSFYFDKEIVDRDADVIVYEANHECIIIFRWMIRMGEVVSENLARKLSSCSAVKIFIEPAISSTKLPL